MLLFRKWTGAIPPNVGDASKNKLNFIFKKYQIKYFLICLPNILFNCSILKGFTLYINSFVYLMLFSLFNHAILKAFSGGEVPLSAGTNRLQTAYNVSFKICYLFIFTPCITPLGFLLLLYSIRVLYHI
jgi:hypothetical protein